MRTLKRKSGKLEEITETPVRKKIIHKFKRKQCAHHSVDGERCKGLTAGKGNFCSIHSTATFIEERKPKSIIEGGLNLQSGLILTRYDQINHPIQFIELSSAGMNLAEIAAELRVSIQTLNEWKEVYPMFGKAYEIGKAAHEAWYLRQGKANLDNRWFQTPLFKFLTMNNGMGWSDKAETKSTQQGTFGVLLVPGQMSMDEWEQQNIKEDEALEQEIIEMEKE